MAIENSPADKFPHFQQYGTLFELIFFPASIGFINQMIQSDNTLNYTGLFTINCMQIALYNSLEYRNYCFGVTVATGQIVY